MQTGYLFLAVQVGLVHPEWDMLAKINKAKRKSRIVSTYNNFLDMCKISLFEEFYTAWIRKVYVAMSLPLFSFDECYSHLWIMHLHFLVCSCRISMCSGPESWLHNLCDRCLGSSYLMRVVVVVRAVATRLSMRQRGGRQWRCVVVVTVMPTRLATRQRPRMRQAAALGHNGLSAAGRAATQISTVRAFVERALPELRICPVEKK
jgi:hypothetical protein